MRKKWDYREIVTRAQNVFLVVAVVIAKALCLAVFTSDVQTLPLRKNPSYNNFILTLLAKELS